MNVKYRIDNGGCRGAYVPGNGSQSLYNTVDAACIAAKTLHENSNRKFPYEIVAVDADIQDEWGFPNAIEIVLKINED